MAGSASFPSSWWLLSAALALGSPLAACDEIRIDALTETEAEVSSGGTLPLHPVEQPDGGQGGSLSDDQEEQRDQEPDPDMLDEPAVAGELCSPCTKSSQCGGNEDLCITFRDSEDYHCGRRCYRDRDCPEGYECVRVRGVDSRQCASRSRTCPPEL